MKRSFNISWQERENLGTDIIKLMHQCDVPGLAISVIHDGELYLSQGYGFADKKKKCCVDIDTVFQVGSISKALTAWGIMDLVRDKLVDLDQPVEKYLSRWHLPDTIFNKDEVTLRRVLSHTAGLSVRSYLGVCNGEKYTIEQSVSGSYKKLYKVQQIQKADRFLYSGGGYSVVQLMIEEVTGVSFASFMKERVLKPLGMEYSTFEFEEYGKDIVLAKPYGVFGGELPIYQFTEKAAAGLYTTLHDMTKFAFAHIEGSNPILSNDMIKEIFTRVKRDIMYGLGYKIMVVDKKKIIMTTGMNRGWVNAMAFVPLNRDLILIMTNSLNGSALINSLLGNWYEKCNNLHNLNDYMFMHNKNKIKTFFIDKMLLMRKDM